MNERITYITCIGGFKSLTGEPLYLIRPQKV